MVALRSSAGNDAYVCQPTGPSDWSVCLVEGSDWSTDRERETWTEARRVEASDSALGNSKDSRWTGAVQCALISYKR